MCRYKNCGQMLGLGLRCKMEMLQVYPLLLSKDAGNQTHLFNCSAIISMNESRNYIMTILLELQNMQIQNLRRSKNIFLQAETRSNAKGAGDAARKLGHVFSLGKCGHFYGFSLLVFLLGCGEFLRWWTKSSQVRRSAKVER